MPAKPRACFETTVVGYLTAWKIRHLVRAARQQVTRDWWVTREAVAAAVPTVLEPLP